jgi:hypothetical protein
VDRRQDVQDQEFYRDRASGSCISVGAGRGLRQGGEGAVALTKRGKAFGSKPAEEWWTLFISFVRDLRWPSRRYPADPKPFWAEEVAALWRYYLGAMRQGENGIDVGVLRDAAWDRAAFIYDIDDLTPQQVEWQMEMIQGTIVHGFFEPLAMLNAIDSATLKAPPVKPTALGRWAAERFVFVMEGRTEGTAEAYRRGNVHLAQGSPRQ